MFPKFPNPKTQDILVYETCEQLSIPKKVAGKRLDKAISLLFPTYSRSRIQKWLKEGRILLDNCKAEADQIAVEGTTIKLQAEKHPIEQSFLPENINFNVLYEDSSILVIDKQAGLVIHPAPGNWTGTLLNGLLFRYPQTAPYIPRAGIIHRLDKDTSGLLVVARTLSAQTNLIRQMQERAIKRRYLAFVWGIPPEKGIIDAPIGREPNHRCRMATLPKEQGRAARTHFRLLKQGFLEEKPISLLQCDLETGRTHQIRVHLESIGHPLVGDPVYSRRHLKKKEHLQLSILPSSAAMLIEKKIENNFCNIKAKDDNKTFQVSIQRQALHAWQLGLNNPASYEWCEWSSTPPKDMQMLAAASKISLPQAGQL